MICFKLMVRKQHFSSTCFFFFYKRLQLILRFSFLKFSGWERKFSWWSWRNCALTRFDWLIDLLLMDQQPWVLSLRENRVKCMERTRRFLMMILRAKQRSCPVAQGLLICYLKCLCLWRSFQLLDDMVKKGKGKKSLHTSQAWSE